ncbi:hypothetical protein Avbf_00233 [Armadillidium vulgare]|nr:hypothetical protein Avbf_00233 [Armadillidium vulgare]
MEDSILSLTETSSSSSSSVKVSSYKCVICGTSFSQGYNYKRHMLTHSGFKPYACPMCPYRSTQSNNVKRHLANVHSIS